MRERRDWHGEDAEGAAYLDNQCYCPSHGKIGHIVFHLQWVRHRNLQLSTSS